MFYRAFPIKYLRQQTDKYSYCYAIYLTNIGLVYFSTLLVFLLQCADLKMHDVNQKTFWIGLKANNKYIPINIIANIINFLFFIFSALSLLK